MEPKLSLRQLPHLSGVRQALEPGEKKKVIKKCRQCPVQPGGPYAPPSGSGEFCSLTIPRSTNFLKLSTPSDYGRPLSLLLLIMSELCWGKIAGISAFPTSGLSCAQQTGMHISWLWKHCLLSILPGQRADTCRHKKPLSVEYLSRTI